MRFFETFDRSFNVCDVRLRVLTVCNNHSGARHSDRETLTSDMEAVAMELAASLSPRAQRDLLEYCNSKIQEMEGELVLLRRKRGILEDLVARNRRREGDERREALKVSQNRRRRCLFHTALWRRNCD